MDKKELRAILDGMVNQIMAKAPEGVITESSARAMLGMALQVNAGKLVEACKVPGEIS